MFHVNDDTNDELFRKAAEDYFLGSDNADWDSLLKKMNTHPDPNLPDTTCPKKKKPFIFLLLVNYPVSFFRLFRRGTRIDKSKKKIDVRTWLPVGGWRVAATVLYWQWYKFSFAGTQCISFINADV